ncbi:hypothetical protein EYF80_010443 [Liparis tanakae]|uniref:Uncharacterized protein n=1 Tax=Liparis tanakae TaxID=230148 RepID=A0A4Z2IMF4_9TELE|nr:hypothetical protein EYF80_010443 [Liparis tanakae]
MIRTSLDVESAHWPFCMGLMKRFLNSPSEPIRFLLMKLTMQWSLRMVLSGHTTRAVRNFRFSDSSTVWRKVTTYKTTQVSVHLHKRLFGQLILIQDQLGGDGAHHLTQLILDNNALEHKLRYFLLALCFLLGFAATLSGSLLGVPSSKRRNRVVITHLAVNIRLFGVRHILSLGRIVHVDVLLWGIRGRLLLHWHRQDSSFVLLLGKLRMDIN